MNLNKALRIVHITSRIDKGGGTTYILKLLKYFKDHKSKELEQYLISPDPEDFKKNIKETTEDHLMISHRSINFLDLYNIIRFCRKKNINALHSHGFGGGILGRLVGTFLGIRVIHTFHGLHCQKNFKSKIKQKLEFILSLMTDVAIFCSEDEQNSARTLKLRMKNGVLLRNFAPEPKEQEVKVLTNKRIGVVARNDQIKGLDLLGKKLNVLLEEIPEYSVLIAGTGQIDIGLNEKFKNKVHFLGDVENMNDFYEKIDLLVSNSREEGMPMSVLEAMSRGLPCLLSNVRGHKYFIRRGAAVGFELYDERALVNILKNEELFSLRVSEKINSANKLLIQNHQLEEHANELMMIYKNLMED